MAWRSRHFLAIAVSLSAVSWLACVGDEPESVPGRTGDADGGLPNESGSGDVTDGGDADGPHPSCTIGDASYTFCDTFDGVPLSTGFVPPWDELSRFGAASMRRDNSISVSSGQSALFHSDARDGGTSETFARLVKTFIGPRRRAALRFAAHLSADSFPAPGEYYVALAHFEALLGSTPGYFIVSAKKRFSPTETPGFIVGRSAYAGGQLLFGEEITTIDENAWTLVELAVDFAERSMNVIVNGTKLPPHTLPAEIGDAPAVKVHLGGAATSSPGGQAAWRIHYDDVGIAYDP